MTYVTLTPEFQARLIPLRDPERNFAGNVCANGGEECAGDVRFYDWPAGRDRVRADRRDRPGRGC